MTSLFIFLYGLAVGSFINAAIYRLHQKRSLGGRSFCPHCKKQLKAIDLIPVLSFLFLGGKCRNCKKNISLQYPLVELSTGLIFAAVFLKAGLTLEALFWLYFVGVSIFIFAYDLKYMIIPNKVVYPALIIAGTYIVYRYAGGEAFIWWSIGAAFVLGLFFFILSVIADGALMGGGDVKLVFLMGLILPIGQFLLSLFLAFNIAALLSIFILIKKKTLKVRIPFGPFLISGMLIAYFFGPPIIDTFFSSLILF